MESRVFTIESDGRPDGSIIRCTGEIDISNVEELRRALDRSVDLGLPEIEVDLVRITFLDSSAIRTLMQAHRELTRDNRRLRVNGGPHASYLLRLLGIDSLLEITEGDARP